jgi:hypothetical protein
MVERKERNIVIAYMNERLEVIKKVPCIHPNPAAERASGYLANQHVYDPKKGYAVRAEIFEKDSPHIVHAVCVFTMGTGEVNTTYKRNPRDFENRYAVTPLLEESARRHSKRK